MTISSNEECLKTIDELVNLDSSEKLEAIKAIYKYMKINYVDFYVNIEDRATNTTKFIDLTRDFLRGLNE
jgi:hypothetical protein